MYIESQGVRKDDMNTHIDDLVQVEVELTIFEGKQYMFFMDTKCVLLFDLNKTENIFYHLY